MLACRHDPDVPTWMWFCSCPWMLFWAALSIDAPLLLWIHADRAMVLAIVTVFALFAALVRKGHVAVHADFKRKAFLP